MATIYDGINAAMAIVKRLTEENLKLHQSLKEKDIEIMRLKARLYDMIDQKATAENEA